MLREVALSSAVLGRDMTYYIYLPPGYVSETRPYSVLYLLHGRAGDKEEWLYYGLIDQADAAITSGAIEPMLIVLPQGDTSDWVDHREAEDVPAWGDYLVFEVVDHVDAHFRTIASPQARAIGGLSIGAFGALVDGLEHPDRFGVIGAHSPSLYEDLSFGSGEQTSSEDGELHAAGQQILLDIGSSDPWSERVAELHVQMTRGAIPHEWWNPPGEHSGDYWSAEVPEYLHFYSEALAATNSASDSTDVSVSVADAEKHVPQP